VTSEATAAEGSASLGPVERYLSLWVVLCIVAGIALGRLIPAPFQRLGRATIAEVNIPVVLLVWLTIVPMLLTIDFVALHEVRARWPGRRHPVHQLGSQAVLNGAARRALHRPPLRPAAAGVERPFLYRRPRPAARRADPDPGLSQCRPRRLANKRLGVACCVAGPSALIGASNFFELAVATAIALFGLNSEAALATVVGVLIEVPVMLSVMRIVLATRRWYQGT
jgi:ACR3 family arsenite efflux pump ArsB